MGKCTNKLAIDKFEKKLEEIKQFAEKEVLPKAKHLDLTDEFPYSLCEKMHQLKCFSLLIPEKFGGEGFTITETAKIIEEISYASAAISLLIICHTVGLIPIIFFGNEKQKKFYFNEVIQNKKLFAFALTEAKAGSDASAIKSVAKKSEKGDKYIIKGHKAFVTNVGISDYYTTFAKTEARKGSRGITCFVVPRDFNGVQITSVEEKIGMRGIPCGNMKFRNVQISEDARINTEGTGFKIAMETLNKSRPFIAAQAIGITRYALKRALAYASKRKQFGKPIARHQGVMFKLSKMATHIEAAKCLTYKATSLLDENHPEQTKFSAMCKSFATDIAMEASIDAIQIFGGYATYRNGDIERLMRDAKITQIFEGSNEIQNVVIGNFLFKEADFFDDTE